MESLQICEKFSSIQGESSFAGCPCTFLRLAGCNLDCGYCDTVYAKSPYSGEVATFTELLEFVESARIPLVEITGGEPLMQPGINDFCRLLLEKSYTVLLETNGSLPIENVPAEVVKIIDCKTPSSGESEKMCWENFRLLASHDEIKFVIADEADYRYSLEIINKYDLAAGFRNLLFSPVSGKLLPEKLAAWMVRDAVPARLQLQLHKIIWNENLRGV